MSFFLIWQRLNPSLPQPYHSLCDSVSSGYLTYCCRPPLFLVKIAVGAVMMCLLELMWDVLKIKEHGTSHLWGCWEGCDSVTWGIWKQVMYLSVPFYLFCSLYFILSILFYSVYSVNSVQSVLFCLFCLFFSEGCGGRLCASWCPFLSSCLEISISWALDGSISKPVDFKVKLHLILCDEDGRFLRRYLLYP